MKQSINQLKQWFETGDYPTQQQFCDVFESFLHLDSEIAIDKVTGLLEALQGKADVDEGGSELPYVIIGPGVNTWAVPEGTLIQKVWLIEPANTDGITIGRTNGGNDIFEAFNLRNGGAIITIDAPFYTPGNIYFNGILSTTIVKIFKG